MKLQRQCSAVARWNRRRARARPRKHHRLSGRSRGKNPDGTTGYPETVLLRLLSSKGGPNIKIAATEDGSGMVLGGESDPTHIQLLARGTKTSVKLTDKDGRQQVIQP